MLTTIIITIILFFSCNRETSLLLPNLANVTFFYVPPLLY